MNSFEKKLEEIKNNNDLSFREKLEILEKEHQKIEASKNNLKVEFNNDYFLDAYHKEEEKYQEMFKNIPDPISRKYAIKLFKELELKTKEKPEMEKIELKISESEKKFYEGMGLDLKNPKIIEEIMQDENQKKTPPVEKKKSGTDISKETLNKPHPDEKKWSADKKYLAALQELLEEDDIQIMQENNMNIDKVEDIITYLTSQGREKEIPDYDEWLKEEMEAKGLSTTKIALKMACLRMKSLGLNPKNKSSCKTFVEGMF